MSVPKLVHVPSLIVLVVALGCSAPPAAAPTPRPERTAPARPLDPYARAVLAGTRDSSGRPGPGYWQQYARYDLQAQLLPSPGRLKGTAHIRYFNNSPDSLPQLAIQLYQNINRTVTGPLGGELTDGMHLTRVVAEGVELQERAAGEPGWRVDGTIGWVTLPRALAAHDSIDLDIAWWFTVPRGAQRMGTDGSIWFLAYWYPQLAVYDDVTGWEADQYEGTGEFYMGYADYTVRLTVPEGYIMDATGVLQNPREVWSDSSLARLARARTTDAVVHVVRERERGAGPNHATRKGSDGTLTWQWNAPHVRDFVFGTSDDYLLDATRAFVPGRSDTVDIRALYRPDATEWKGAARDGRFAIEYFSRMLWPYPWPHMTAVEGPEAGMEYPMMTQIAAFGDSTTLFSVIAHEIGHMWFPMMVGSDEKRHAWMDEGFTQYDESQADRAFDSTNTAEHESQQNYISYARTTGEQPLTLCGDCYRKGSDAYVIAAYEKPVAILRALRGVLGDSVYLMAFREYGRRWQDKHPQPQDFFETVNNISGRNLDWFWHEWFETTDVLDQGIEGVTDDGDSLTVSIVNRGGAVMPLRLLVMRVDGTSQLVRVPITQSRAKLFMVRIRDEPAVNELEIDPDALFPDVNRHNNHWHR